MLNQYKSNSAIRLRLIQDFEKHKDFATSYVAVRDHLICGSFTVKFKTVILNSKARTNYDQFYNHLAKT